jgi:anti-anti-sigma factor
MEINYSTVQGRVPVMVMRLKGNLDSDSSEQFNQAAQKLVADGTKDVLIDMTGVPFMSSVGIRSLSMLYDLLHQTASAEEKKAVLEATRAGTYKAPHLKLFGLQDHVLNIIKMVNMDWYIEIFTSEKEALAKF